MLSALKILAPDRFTISSLRDMDHCELECAIHNVLYDEYCEGLCDERMELL